MALPLCLFEKELKKRRLLLQPKRHFKMELCSRLSVCDYSIFVKLYKISEVSSRLFGTNGLHVKAVNKDSLLRAHVVVRTSNMKNSRRRLADYVKKLHQKACRTCSANSKQTAI